MYDSDTHGILFCEKIKDKHFFVGTPGFLTYFHDRFSYYKSTYSFGHLDSVT